MNSTQRPTDQTPDVQEMFADAVSHHRAGRLPEAERLYRRILAIDPRHADSLNLLGLMASRAGCPDLAAELIVQAIAIKSDVASYHTNLGNVRRAQGRLEEAVASYGQAIELQPDSIEALHNLGLARLKQGRLEEAATSFGQALDHRPDSAEILHNLGLARQRQGRLQEATACYRRVLDLKPASPEAHYNLGNGLNAQGRSHEAATCYRRALVLKPNAPEVLVNLGNALQERGDLPQAVTCYGRALAVSPDFIEARNNLGNTLKDQGRVDDATALYRGVIALNPDFAPAYVNLGLALRAAGKIDGEAFCYRRALALKPDDAECRLVTAMSELPIFVGTVAEGKTATATFEQALESLVDWGTDHPAILGEAVGSSQPFYLAYRPGDHRRTLSRFGDLSALAAKAHWQDARGFVAEPPGKRDRLRIGVVSAHIRRHPVWDVVLRGILGNLDRQRFEIFLYHTAPQTDAETAWATGQATRFAQGPKPMEAWLRAIGDDRPDILFYPEIGMDPTTTALAALRLAPLQVAGWGHPITTGLPTIDLFLSGALLEADDADRHYREKLVRLPGTGVCTEPPAPDSHPKGRTTWGSPSEPDVVRFALCQTPFKFDPEYDPLYVQIAKAAGPCQFWLARDRKYPWASDRLQRRLADAFRSAGLDPDSYLRMTPWLPREKFVGFLDAMDIYLDCPAFSGYTTAWQALHRGLPIVTLEGRFLRQRLAAGLLRQIGQTEGIASTVEDYVATAVRWALARRQSGRPAPGRSNLRRAAARADGNHAAIRALEQALQEASGCA
ncbi:tetratricopeptide repeat protein [Telmatospirillum sp.]|uniref:tetratricopeptide repeat protein n=1 Tax=Telmatospirillum sp. TaxID=2079197 RepID=UPI00283D1495|nr:tetratricopeptide repeat protein [Telmatospirillum sp.]MDR3440888.1 tetratricopeptide repeat protein [Telmatospirillum sp.]